jgi:hypothetical protein
MSSGRKALNGAALSVEGTSPLRRPIRQCISSQSRMVSCCVWSSDTSAGSCLRSLCTATRRPIRRRSVATASRALPHALVTAATKAS